MRLSGFEIRKQGFPIRLRGYDRLDVDAFLQGIADLVDELTRKNEDLSEQCADLERKLGEMQQRDETLQRALVAMSDLREEANRRAEELLQHAEEESARLGREAETEASRVREEVRRETGRAREELSQIVHLRERVLAELFETLRTQLRVVEGESQRLGVDVARLVEAASGKVISFNTKAEGERP